MASVCAMITIEHNVLITEVVETGSERRQVQFHCMLPELGTRPSSNCKHRYVISPVTDT